MIKAYNGSLLYNECMERQQPWQPSSRNVQQQVTLLLSEVETESQRDVVDRVVGLRSSSLDESSPETNFIPEPCAKTLPRGRRKFWI